MIINILNFTNGFVDILQISPELEEEINNIEDYLSQYYNLDEISYMTTDYINLNIRKKDE